MAFTLQLTGASVGDLDLNDQTKPSGAHPYSIMVQNWRPRVARRRTGRIGGIPYEDVEEMLPLAVLGYTRAAVLDGLNDLAAALDEARLWFLGDPNYGPILLKWLPEGSSLGAAVQTAVLGPAGGDDLLRLQPAFNKELQAYYVECEAGLLRRGMWLGPETSQTDSDTTNPVILSAASFSDVPSVEVLAHTNNYLQDASGDNTFVYVAFSSDSAGLNLFEAESPTSSSGLTSTADSDASGGNIMRMSTGFAQANARYRISNATPGRYAVYATMRNNSASNTFTVSLEAVTYNILRDLGVQNVTVIEPSFGPKPVFLGIVYVPAAADILDIYLYIQASATVTGGNALDYDTVLVVALDKNSGVIYNPEFMLLTADTIGKTAIDHKLLVRPQGGVFRQQTGETDSPMPYLGNPYVLAKGTTSYSVIYGTTTGHWRVMRYNTGTASYLVLGSVVTVTRRPFYLIPK